MDRLSGLDASFLYLETPHQLMHVCGLLVLDPTTMPTPYEFNDFQNKLGERVKDVPAFTRKLRRTPLGFDHPIWVPDERFNIERHVHRQALPTPGGYAELMSLTSHLAGLPLDRSRPLWEMWVIEGYRPDPEGADRLVVFMKMHHATVDGVSGANLLSHLCGLSPDEAHTPYDGPAPQRDASPAELFGRGAVRLATRPFTAVKLLSPTSTTITKTIARARAGTAMAAPLTAPRAPFNGTITGRRTIATVDLDLADVRALKSATGTTVNDVVLAMAGGALRSYLLGRGVLPEESLLASVPVSVRESSRRTGGSNKVSSLFARLGTDEPDPLARLQAMAENNRNAREHHDAISADTLQDWAEFAAPRTFGLAVRAYAGLRLAERHRVVHNLVISNVPGPPIPLYFVGAQILGLYPLGPVFHGAGLNITVASNAGRLHVGLIACREAMPDIQELVEQFPHELAQMMAAAQIGG